MNNREKIKSDLLFASMNYQQMLESVPPGEFAFKHEHAWNSARRSCVEYARDLLAEVDRLAAENDRLAIVNADLVIALIKVEWSDIAGGRGDVCPSCMCSEEIGHASDCQLAKALAKAEKT